MIELKHRVVALADPRQLGDQRIRSGDDGEDAPARLLGNPARPREHVRRARDAVLAEGEEVLDLVDGEDDPPRLVPFAGGQELERAKNVGVESEAVALHLVDRVEPLLASELEPDRARRPAFARVEGPRERSSERPPDERHLAKLDGLHVEVDDEVCRADAPELLEKGGLPHLPEAEHADMVSLSHELGQPEKLLLATEEPLAVDRYFHGEEVAPPDPVLNACDDVGSRLGAAPGKGAGVERDDVLSLVCEGTPVGGFQVAHERVHDEPVRCALVALPPRGETPAMSLDVRPGRGSPPHPDVAPPFDLRNGLPREVPFRGDREARAVLETLPRRPPFGRAPKRSRRAGRWPARPASRDHRGFA